MPVGKSTSLQVGHKIESYIFAFILLAVLIFFLRFQAIFLDKMFHKALKILAQEIRSTNCLDLRMRVKNVMTFDEEIVYNHEKALSNSFSSLVDSIE
jgi:hypothetical protein